MRATWAHKAMLAAVPTLGLLAACGGGSVPRVTLASESAVAGAPPASAAPTVTAASSSVRSAVASPPPAPPSAAASAVAAPSYPVVEHKLPGAARLKIPGIGVDAPLVPLGVDRDGLMEVPANGTDVGWYSFSAVPGTIGNAVLSGHVDTAASARAVFARLKDLKQGDQVSLSEGSRQTDFQVFWTKAWLDSEAPLPLILGSAPSPTLTLITCSGAFDRATNNYSSRLVVRAKLPGSI